MAKHVGLFLDAADLKTIIDALLMRRKDVERYMRSNERKGFKIPEGKHDVNLINHAALSRALQNINSQIRNEETRK